MDEPFGRQPQPVQITVTGREAEDVVYWVAYLKRACEAKADLVEQHLRAATVACLRRFSAAAVVGDVRISSKSGEPMIPRLFRFRHDCLPRETKRAWPNEPPHTTVDFSRVG